MKRIPLYIALGAVMMLTSCITDNPDCITPQPMETAFPVSFTIQLATEGNSARMGTRDGVNPDTPDGNENISSESDKGTAFDNKIASIVPVLYAYTGDATSGELVYSLPVAELVEGTLTMTPKGDDEIATQYDVTGQMKCNDWSKEMLLDPNAKLRLVVYLNCSNGDIATPLDIRDPGNALFYHHGQPDHKDEYVSGSQYFHSIPMFGAANVKFKEENKKDGSGNVEKDSNGNPVKIVNAYSQDGNKISIPILRAMAKIKVLLDLDEDSADGVELVSLYMERHSEQGYVLPKEWSTCYNTQTLFNNPAATINPFNDENPQYNHDCTIYPETEPEDNKHADEENFYSDNTEKLRFYLPDTYNHEHDGRTSKEIFLRLTYRVGVERNEAKGIVKEGTEYSHLMWFRPQGEWPETEAGLGLDATTPINYPTSSNNPWDIIRNHIYEFKIQKVEKASGNLTIQACVKDWKYYHYDIEL